MTRVVPDKLTIFALYVLEDLLADLRRHTGPWPRTWGVRLSLSYLHHRGLVSKEVAAAIWIDLSRPSCDMGDETWSYCRYRDINGYIEGMFKNAGLYRGRPHRREISDGPQLRPLIEPPPDPSAYVPPPPKPPWKPEPILTTEEWHARKAAMDATRGNSIQTTHPRNKRKKSPTVGKGSR